MFTHPRDDWFFYLLGAVLTLAWKWWVWCRTGRHLGKTIRQSTREWLDTSLAVDKASWITTVAVVWVFGSVYIGRVAFMWEWVQAIPVERSIAFMFGSLMEYIAPNAVKWVISKLPAQG